MNTEASSTEEDLWAPPEPTPPVEISINPDEIPEGLWTARGRGDRLQLNGKLVAMFHSHRDVARLMAATFNKINKERK